MFLNAALGEIKAAEIKLELHPIGQKEESPDWGKAYKSKPHMYNFMKGKLLLIRAFVNEIMCENCYSSSADKLLEST